MRGRLTGVGGFMTVRRRTWILAFAVPGMTLTGDETQRRVPMRDVSIRGSATAATREVALVVQTVIASRLGRFAVNARMHLTYDCRSHFTGTVAYHPLVRLFARIKRLDLITRVVGSVEAAGATGCPALDVKDIHGGAKAEATELAGYVWLGRDSLGFHGPAWMLGDTSYHSVVASHRGLHKIVLRVSMFE